MIKTLFIFLGLFLMCNSYESQKNIELDHFFIFTDNYLVQDTMLKNLGFNPKISHHDGQGTSSSIVFFQNFYLEFISIDDSIAFVKNNELNSLLWKKQKIENTNGSSPFGVGIQLVDYENKIPFKTFDYNQKWMRENTNIKIANSTNKNFNEPYIFILPEYLKWRMERYNFKKHSNTMGLINLTSINIHCPNCSDLSKTTKEVNQLDEINFFESETYFVKIIFDNQNQGKSKDFRPELPLALEY